MSDVTRILSAIEQGNPHAAEQLLPLVYDGLRMLAAQKLAPFAPRGFKDTGERGFPASCQLADGRTVLVGADPAGSLSIHDREQQHEGSEEGA
jgi:hypothetical protein